MNDTSTRPDGMAGKIEEEFEKYLYEPLACLDRDDLEFIENDNGCQFISLTEADRVARDNAENGFTAGFHVAFKPLMEENERLNKELGLRHSWVKHHQRTVEIEMAKNAKLKDAVECLAWALKTIKHTDCDTYRVSADALMATKKVREQFNLDNDSKGERV